MVKVLGFDSDFGIDRIMKTKLHIGFWPDADTRRWVCSDQSAIDASRFGGTAISPYAATASYWPTHYFQYQADAQRIVDMGVFAENKAKPELGSAAYHYDPRTAATVQVTYGSVTPGIAEYGAHNDAFKKDSMWAVAPPEKFHEECEKDWWRYCEKFTEDGSTIEPPEYPYTIEYTYWLLYKEEEDGMKMGVRQGTLTNEMMEFYLKQIQGGHQEKCRIYNERRDERIRIEKLRREALKNGTEPPPPIEPWPAYGHLAPAEAANFDGPKLNQSEGKKAHEMYKAQEALKAAAVARSADMSN
jgi:hypothetical protein